MSDEHLIELVREALAAAEAAEAKAATDVARYRAVLDTLNAEPGEAAPMVAHELYAAVERAKAQRERDEHGRAGGPGPRGRPRLYDRAEVARIARDAMERGERPLRSVAEHFGITDKAAQQRIDAARKAGHDIPRVLSPPKRAAPSTPDKPPEVWTPERAMAVLEGGQ